MLIRSVPRGKQTQSEGETQSSKFKAQANFKPLSSKFNRRVERGLQQMINRHEMPRSGLLALGGVLEFGALSLELFLSFEL
jgi:hypothetical protein